MIGSTLDRLDSLFDSRFAARPSWVVLAELFLGIGWLRSAAAKVISTEWWAGDVLSAFVVDHDAVTIGWFAPVLDALIVNNAQPWDFVVVVLECLIGFSLLSGRRLGVAITLAIFLNICFVLVGSSNPSIFYLVLQLGLGLWILETSSTPTVSLRALRAAVVALAVLAMACVPFIGTLDPAAVIDDPASVLIAWSICGAVAAAAARRRVRRAFLQVATIDLRRATAQVHR